MVKAGDMMSIDDTLEILAVDLIGVVPDDDQVVISTNKGEPVVQNEKSLSGQAFRDIAKRIKGEEVPFMDLEEEGSFLSKLRKMVGLE